jgi:hypothetical protein
MRICATETTVFSIEMRFFFPGWSKSPNPNPSEREAANGTEKIDTTRANDIDCNLS